MSKELPKFNTAEGLINANKNGVTESHLFFAKHLRRNDSPEKAKEVLLIADFIKTNTTLTNLDLSGNNINDEGIKAIVEALKANITLKGFKISGKDVGAIAIAEVLETNATLTNIELSNSEINFYGAKAITGVLKNNTTVKKLDLSHNNTGVEGAGAIAELLGANGTLKSLNLQSNGLGVEGARIISEGLRKNTTLTSLNIGFNEKENEDTKDFVGFLGHASLKSLKLKVNKVEDVKAIAKLLKNNTTLLEFDLCAIGVDSTDIIDALKTNTTLKSLILSGCKLGDEGPIKIKEMLKANSTLKNLRLSGSEIGIEGARAIVEGLKDNTILTSLHLSGRIGKENMAEIKRYTDHNIKLSNAENLARQAAVVCGFLGEIGIVGENGSVIELPEDVRRVIGLLTDDVGVNKIELHSDAAVCKSAAFADKSWAERAIRSKEIQNILGM